MDFRVCLIVSVESLDDEPLQVSLVKGKKSQSKDISPEFCEAFEKHLSDFLGLKDKMRTLGLGQYTLKLYRISKCDGKVENFDISTLPQYKLELPSLLTGESELNGK